ncbi:uncharacterized protein TRIADDRAFT_52827 [Trichoplax adhaerens]|uniref:Uncharacterized protein n=1 Tax=Trichoplax adhaerens TaxID=10228 RepID=B3RKM8_TRIAD|nr:predicted protein [Trichoplax adhaerens]EDV29920.1 predicted protein [Trichoplax adhaerens]|eukprot:XP_002109122.1 predicted protein [Trichoplax adhaerens]
MKLEKNFRSPFNNQRDFLLSHLLPYDPNNNKAKKLDNGLREYLLLIIAAEQALEIVAKKDINRYQNVPLISLKKETPAIVLIGSTARDFNNLPSVHDWKKELIASGPIDIFLACAATHKQYPNEMAGEEIYKDQIQNKEFQFYRKKAFEWGCCLQNASRFFWSHVYCDSIENISLSSFETADNS